MSCKFVRIPFFIHHETKIFIAFIILFCLESIFCKYHRGFSIWLRYGEFVGNSNTLLWFCIKIVSIFWKCGTRRDSVEKYSHWRNKHCVHQESYGWYHVNILVWLHYPSDWYKGSGAMKREATQKHHLQFFQLFNRISFRVTIYKNLLQKTTWLVHIISVGFMMYIERKVWKPYQIYAHKSVSYYKGKRGHILY